MKIVFTMDFRLVPLCGLLVFTGIAFGWRTWLQWRYHGGHGIELFRRGAGRQQLRDLLFLGLVAALFMEAVGAATGRVAVSTASVLRVLGTGCLVVGTVCTVVAQLDLGASWRIGIDPDARPGLVTTGWYRWSRNPIFLFMLTFLVGFTLLVPDPMSVAVLVASYLAIRAQVRDEERYLHRAYGEVYDTYVRRVPRFLPRFGMLTFLASLR